MEVQLRCPQGHISRWVLGNVIESFEIHCSACNKSYTAVLLPDGSWVAREKNDNPQAYADSGTADSLLNVKGTEDNG